MGIKETLTVEAPQIIAKVENGTSAAKITGITNLKTTAVTGAQILGVLKATDQCDKEVAFSAGNDLFKDIKMTVAKVTGSGKTCADEVANDTAYANINVKGESTINTDNEYKFKVSIKNGSDSVGTNLEITVSKN